ncbi:MAG TPA: YezD family protein [Chitinispirillaceae bacterium]|nr:YezD family protein [Chitinispirillaceae bacterium]
MPQKQESTKGEVINEKLIRRIADSLKGVKFGHVLITIHNHKVVQIDRTEKNRCELIVLESDGGGI